MSIGFSSAARNLFLLGSTGAQVVTNFFKTIDQSAGTDGVYIPDEIKYNFVDQKFVLAGSAEDSNSKGFGWFEKRNEAGTADFENRIESTQSAVNTTLRAMELDSNDNLIVVGKTGDVPWIAKYSNGGVIGWQATTNSASVEYTGITSSVDTVTNLVNYYACGNTPTSGEAQAFVEKFDVSGNPGWGKSAFMLGRDVVLNRIAANARGEVVAVGYLEDDIYNKGYIIKIDTNTGEVLWDRTLSPDWQGDMLNCSDVYIDSNDQIYVTVNGTFVGYLIKYTAEGNMIWQKTTDDPSSTITFDRVKSDGETEQTVVLGTYDDGSGDVRGVLSKYSKDGSLVWRRTLLSTYNSSDYFSNVCLDADPSFYYLLFVDDVIDGFSGTPDRYTFGKVSSSGNGLGNFSYFPDSFDVIDYTILSVGDKIGRLSDGSVRQDTSDLITYPFNANKILFDDLATQISNKKRQMDGPDSFEYSGSPAIRPADFQELNLLGDTGFVDETTGGGSTTTLGAQTWSNDLTTANPANGFFEAATLAFDGGNDTSASTNSTGIGNQIVWSPSQFPAANGPYTLEVLCRDLDNNGGFGQRKLIVNGTTVFDPATDTLPTRFFTVSNLTEITSVIVERTLGTGRSRLDTIKVNGTELIDGQGITLPVAPTPVSKVKDQSGKGNDGVVNGATLNAAGYWEFDGVDDRILIDDDGRFHFAENGSDFGIEAWVRRTGDNNSYTTIAASWGQSTPIDNWILSHNLGILGFVWAPYSTGSYFLTGGSLTLNNWHHVIATRSGNDFKLYVDGIETASGTNSGSASSTLSYIEIGHYGSTSAGGGAGSWFDGDIGEVRVYPRVLTAAQVFQNYNATKSKYIDEAPDIAPKIGPGIVYDSNLLLNYDFGNRATYDRAENLLPWSEDFTKWTQAVHFWENNYAIAPDGSRTAALLKESIPPQQQLSYFNIATMPNVTVASGDTFTFTVFAKANTHDVLEMHMYGDLQANFNLTTGVTTNNGASMSAVGDGWYFCKWTKTKSNTNGAMYLGISASSYAGVGVDKSLFIWHPQVERGYEYGRYIRTSGTSINALTTVKNLSSSSYTGTINGATFNSAGYFEFDNDYIDAGYSIPTNNFTVETWFKKTDTAYWSPVWACEVWNQSSGYLFYFEGNNVLELTSGGNLTGLLQVNTTGNMTDWRHLVLTIDGSNVATIYQNGVSLGSTTITPVGSIQKPLRLGARFGNDGNGSADGRQTQSGGLRAYNRALSATEVSQNFNATRAKYSV